VSGFHQQSVLILGLNSQDGCYLAHALSLNGTKVVGTVRSAKDSLSRIQAAGLLDLEGIGIEILDVAVGCENRLKELLRSTKFDAIYNFLGQSSVGNSFARAPETLLTNSWFVSQLIDVVSQIAPDARLYLASSSEIFGPGSKDKVFTEKSCFDARSPYAISKADVVWQARNARAQADIFASVGITCNHESPLRARSFVIPKLISGLVERKEKGVDTPLELGCVNVVRDWSFAGDIINAIIRCMRHDEADDFIFASGVSSRLSDVVTIIAEILGWSIEWEIDGEEQLLIDSATGKPLLRGSTNPVRRFDALYVGVDPTHAQQTLNWNTQLTLTSLLEFLVDSAREMAEGRRPKLAPPNFQFYV